MTQILTSRKTLFAFLILFCFTGRLSASGSETFDLNEVILHHLSDSVVFPLNIAGRKIWEGDSDFDESHSEMFYASDGRRYYFVGGLNLHITRRVTMMWIGCLILFAIFIPAANRIARDPMKISGRFASAVEVLVRFIQKDVVDSSMHGHGKAYTHFMLTLFFFILSGNLMGILPPVGEILTMFTDEGHDHILAKIWSGITTTGDISVTMTLALFTFVLIIATGFYYQGIHFIPNSVPKGVPWALWPLMWPLEFIVSPIAKCFALTVRLLANMTTGHVIILALLGFIFKFQSYAIVPISILGAGAIYLLEIFVAFLQAYIFVLLTSIFVGSVMHRH